MTEHLHDSDCEHAHAHDRGHCHDHEHDHDHNRNHDHDHEHDHDHNRNHDHNHEHDHAQALDLGYATIELSSHMHEQAATVSATMHFADGYTAQFSQVADALRQIAAQSETAGGIVGHVKAFAETPQGLSHASCTDAAQGVTTGGDPDMALDSTSRIQLVAIVMLIGLDELERIVIDALS